MIRLLAGAAVWLVVLGAMACSGESEDGTEQDLLPGTDVVDLLAGDVLVVPSDLQSDTNDAASEDLPVPEDLSPDLPGPEDALPPIDWAEDSEPPPPDVLEEVATDVVTECTLAEDCDALHGAAGICGTWLCETGFCIDSPLVEGTECSDDEPCTDGDMCDGYGMCAPGDPIDCDDSEFCTDDLCEAGIGCQHTWKPPQPCVVGDDSGIQ